MFSGFFTLISRIVLPNIVVVGLDIQESHIFGVATVRKRGETHIVASGEYELPPGTIVGGEIKNTQPLEEAVKSLLAQIHTSRWTKKQEPIFVLSLSPAHLFTEAAYFPKDEEVTLADAVRLKIEGSLPWPIAASYVDWSVIKDDPESTGVFIAAISKPILDQYVTLSLANKWKIGAVEFHLFSLVRFVGPDYPASFIFVLIDEDGIELAVFKQKNVMAHYLQKVKDLTDIPKVLEDTVRQVTSYFEGAAETKIERIFIFDKISWQQASTSITNVTGIPTELFTPSPHLDARLSVAYGASLRSYSDGEAPMNLTPPALGGRYQENVFFRAIGLWGKIFFVFTWTFIAAFAVVTVFVTQQETGLRKEVQANQRTLDQKQAQLQPLLDRARYFNILVAQNLEAVTRRTHYGKKVEEVIAIATQSGVAIQTIHPLDTAHLFLVVTAPTRDTAYHFQDALSSSTIFSSVSIPKNQLTPEKNLTLEVTLTTAPTTP